MPDLQTFEIPVAGMDCAECAQHVRHAIAGLPGVEGVEIFMSTKKARVEFDASSPALTAAAIPEVPPGACKKKQF